MEDLIRKIAKKNESVNQFIACTDIASISLFHNHTDFTGIQKLYLSYLYFYKSIYEDIYNDKIKDIVFAHAIYEDAYYLWKQKNKDKKDKKEYSPKAFFGVIKKNKIKHKEEGVSNG